MPNKYKKSVRRESKEVLELLFNKKQKNNEKNEDFSAAAATNNLSDNNNILSAAATTDPSISNDLENEFKCLIDNNSESDYLEENEGLEYCTEQFNIKDELAKWSVKHLISDCALNDLLTILRKLDPNLPKDARSVITQQTCEQVSNSTEIANEVKRVIEPMLTQFKNDLTTAIEPMFLRLTNEVHSLRQEVKELKNPKIKIKRLIMPAHPFKDMEAFLDFEKSLQDDDEKFATFQNELSVVAKLPSFIKNCWRKIFVDELAQNLCWQGTEIKKSVRNLSTTKAIRNAAILLGIGEDQVIKQSRLFFQFAKNRLQRKIKYKESVNL